jgi:hypothetical protein
MNAYIGLAGEALLTVSEVPITRLHRTNGDYEYVPEVLRAGAAKCTGLDDMLESDSPCQLFNDGATLRLPVQRATPRLRHRRAHSIKAREEPGGKSR